MRKAPVRLPWVTGTGHSLKAHTVCVCARVHACVCIPADMNAIVQLKMEHTLVKHIFIYSVFLFIRYG